MLDLWRDRGIDSPLDQSSALQAAKRGRQQSMRHALDEPRHRLEAHGPLRTPRQPPSQSICPCPILDVQHNATPGVRAPQFVAAIDAAVKAGVGHVVLVSSTATREVAEPDIYVAFGARESATWLLAYRDRAVAYFRLARWHGSHMSLGPYTRQQAAGISRTLERLPHATRLGSRLHQISIAESSWKLLGSLLLPRTQPCRLPMPTKTGLIRACS